MKFDHGPSEASVKNPSLFAVDWEGCVAGISVPTGGSGTSNSTGSIFINYSSSKQSTTLHYYRGRGQYVILLLARKLKEYILRCKFGSILNSVKKQKQLLLSDFGFSFGFSSSFRSLNKQSDRTGDSAHNLPRRQVLFLLIFFKQMKNDFNI